MRKNRSKTAHPKYPNLYRLPGQKAWIFRKYSSEKQKSFFCSTQLEAIERNAPAAYRIGIEAYNKFLGTFLPLDGNIYIRDLANAVLASKDDPTLSDSTRANARNELLNHIVPAFGGLRPEDVTKDVWKEYQRTERTRPRKVTRANGVVKTYPPRQKLFNTRKLLIEVLRLAKDKGLIAAVPELPLNDADPAPPRVIPKKDILRIIRFAGRIDAYTKSNGQSVPASRYHSVTLKLLAFIMWKQGCRPGEILQYRWDMIRWNEGKYGVIDIPAPITKTRRARTMPLDPKVSRILRFLEGRKSSPWLFPSPLIPGEPIQEYANPWETVNARLGLDYDIYNLRDTFITGRLRAGKSAVMIGKLVDNSAAIIEKKYAVADQDAMEEVLE